MVSAKGTGTSEDPWVLKTPPGTSDYSMWRDEQTDPPTLVCQVGSTKLGYQLRCIDDLHEMLRERGDRMDLGAADEQKTAKDDTVEAWARSPDDPVGGWYGVKRAFEVDSGCTCHRCSKRWVSQSSSTMRGTIGCERSRSLTGSVRASGCRHRSA